MEAVVAGTGTVGVDRHDRVRARPLPGPSAHVDARPDAGVVVTGHHDTDAAGGQPLRDPLRDVEGEGVLGVPRVGRGPGGVARLRAPASVRYLAVDGGGGAGVAAVVAGVEDHDARPGRRRRRGRRTRCRTRARGPGEGLRRRPSPTRPYSVPRSAGRPPGKRRSAHRTRRARARPRSRTGGGCGVAGRTRAEACHGYAERQPTHAEAVGTRRGARRCNRVSPIWQ